MIKKATLALCVFIALLWFFAPLANLFYLPGLDNYQDILKSEATRLAIKNTIIVSLGVAFFSLFLAIPISWLISRTDLPKKNVWRSLFSMPYVIPPYVGAIGWIILMNPTSGVLTKWLAPLFEFNIYSYAGLIWVETSFLFTFVLLSCLAVLEKMDSSLEEAARLSGANPLRVFLDIHLPIMRPALMSSFILVFLASASSFGVPAMIGGPARIYLLTTQIYTFQRMGTANGLQMAISASALLGIATLILLYGSQALFKESKNQIVGGKTARPSFIKLGPLQYPTLILLSLLIFLILILPVCGILLSALSPVQGSWSIGDFSLQHFNRVLFETDETPRAFFNSILLGLSAAALCTLFAFIVGYFKSRHPSKLSRFLNLILNLPFSTPGTVLALALILCFSRGYFGIGPSLYNTLWLMLIAYFIKYAILSVKTLGDSYEQLHPSLEEAAVISGASWLQVMRTIYWPLLKPALIASLFLVFIPVLSELTMSILLTGPGLETIGTLIFQLQEYSDVGGGGAAVISFLVIVMTVSINYFLRLISRGSYGL